MWSADLACSIESCLKSGTGMEMEVVVVRQLGWGTRVRGL